MAYVHAIRACPAPCVRYRVLSGELDKLQAAGNVHACGVVRSTAISIFAAGTAHPAGARRRRSRAHPCATVADVLFGSDAVATGWHADGDLRARVRRLVRRGEKLMRGGYRRLAQLPPLEQGRFGIGRRTSLSRTPRFLETASIRSRYCGRRP